MQSGTRRGDDEMLESLRAEQEPLQMLSPFRTVDKTQAEEEEKGGAVLKQGAAKS